MPWHSGEVGRILFEDSSLELLNLFPPWEPFICVFDGKLDFTRSSMANFIQIPSKSPGQGGLGPSRQIRAGQQTQPRWIRPDPEFPCFFWWKKFPFWRYQALSSNLGLSEQRGAPTDTGEFCTVNYASLKPSSVDLNREKFQHAFETLAQFPFFACMRLTMIRGSPFSIAVLYPSFNLLKLLTGSFCQTLQWTWHFYAFLNLETCWFSSVFFTLSWSAAELLQSLYPVHLAACRKVEDQWWVSSEAHRTCGATSHLLSISG